MRTTSEDLDVLRRRRDWLKDRVETGIEEGRELSYDSSERGSLTRGVLDLEYCRTHHTAERISNGNDSRGAQGKGSGRGAGNQ
jgi:hypothetical protein